MKSIKARLTFAAITLFTGAFISGCIAEEAEDHGATTQALINPGEAAQAVEVAAGETLSMPNGPTTLGVMEGVFRVKIGGAWSTVGSGLYHNVSEAACVTRGRTMSLASKILYSRTTHIHWGDWSTWNDN